MEDAFFLTRPVMVAYDGTVDYELSHDDFTKRKDGVTASDVSNINYAGNCMIGIPKVFRKYEYNGTGKIQQVYLADDKIDENYKCLSHYNKNGVLLDEIFVQAFEPCKDSSNRLRSIADQTILNNLSGEIMLQYAKNNGACWNFIDWGTIELLQAILMFMFKSTDSQSSMGAGVVGGTRMTTSGSTKNKGMFYATNNTSSSNVANKVLGIENLWGNHYKWINGLVITSTSNGSAVKMKLCDWTADGSTATEYSQTGAGYKTLAAAPASNVTGYAQKMYLDANGLHPYPDSSHIGSGSSSTYLCDSQYLYSATSNDRFARFGGNYNDNANAGLFYVNMNNALSNNNTNYAASFSLMLGYKLSFLMQLIFLSTR